MEHTIEHKPSEATVTVELGPSESVVAEAGALLSHSAGVEVETGARGGLFGSLKRALGGESFFVNTFRSPNGGDSVTFAPPYPGDVVHHEVTEGDTLYVQSGSFLAATEGVEIDTKFGGARSFLGGEGLFLLRLSGAGEAFLASFGAIERVEVTDSFVVDTGHVVAFEGVDWDVERVGGLKSTLFSGEGLVCEFTGTGTVWLQTRSPDAFISWLAPRLPLGGTTNVDSGGSRSSSSSGGFNVRF